MSRPWKSNWGRWDPRPGQDAALLECDRALYSLNARLANGVRYHWPASRMDPIRQELESVKARRAARCLELRGKG